MAPNPTEAEVESEAIEERDQLIALISYLDPKIKEMNELRRNAQRKLRAFPYRKRGPKEGRISHEHSVRQNLYATRYAYDMIQRWRYVQRISGVVFATDNPKPPQSQNDAKDIRGRIIARACSRWWLASAQEVTNKIDRTNADAGNRPIAGVQIFVPRSDEWLSQRLDLDV